MAGTENSDGVAANRGSEEIRNAGKCGQICGAPAGNANPAGDKLNESGNHLIYKSYLYPMVANLAVAGERG
jgi:hypothetical protein